MLLFNESLENEKARARRKNEEKSSFHVGSDAFSVGHFRHHPRRQCRAELPNHL
jgi:hypothetical protein